MCCGSAASEENFPKFMSQLHSVDVHLKTEKHSCEGKRRKCDHFLSCICCLILVPGRFNTHARSAREEKLAVPSQNGTENTENIT